MVDASDPVRDAIAYLMRRLGEDPDVAYYLGYGTESFRQLCLAQAALTGKSFEEVERLARIDRQPSYRRREPEVLMLRKRLNSCTCDAADRDG
jgi:hypothetical protein